MVKSGPPKRTPRPKTKHANAEPRGVPSREELLAFIGESRRRVGAREITRAFGIKGRDQAALKALLKSLKDDDLLAPRGRRKERPAGRLPAVAVIEVKDIDEDGELLARPANWKHTAPPPVIYLAPDRRGGPALAVGDRLLAKLTRLDSKTYEARTIKKLGTLPNRILGVYRTGARGGRLTPTDRRAREDLVVRSEDSQGARSGELVLAEPQPGPPRLGLRAARVIERLGQLGDLRTLSLIAIHEHGLPVDFPPEALAEAQAAGPKSLETRKDLRALPLVTIDGADARDFDDAVWAEPDADPGNPAGWHLVVAIADVAAYVRPGRPLDLAAYARGNSAYFPDRVVPMLPEALSNGWCSLIPGEDRPCLAAELWIDKAGRARRHRFVRGLMRSAARLTYEQVQAARDGRPDAVTDGLAQTVLESLFGAFESLLAERKEREPLDLELTERRIVFDQPDRVSAIEPRARLDSHRLIEEFMIAANRAAAEQIEALGQACMYRIHERPDPVKIAALGQILESLDLRLARGHAIRPGALNRVITQVRGTAAEALVNQLILRAQSQAVYSPRNRGHFGLALRHYAHFTSPIRRYADLLVHRALIAGLGLGADGLTAEVGGRFAEIGEQISLAERRAVAAERNATDRFAAAFLQDKIGAQFSGTINGVTRFGLFITLDETGAEGLVPIATLPEDYYDHIEARHCLEGRRWGRVYRLGESVTARLVEADPASGRLNLALPERDDPDSLLPNSRPSNSRPSGPRSRPAGGWHPLNPAKPGTSSNKPSGAKRTKGHRKRRPKQSSRQNRGS